MLKISVHTASHANHNLVIVRSKEETLKLSMTERLRFPDEKLRSFTIMTSWSDVLLCAQAPNCGLANYARKTVPQRLQPDI
jgi:hypothetical protein